jgi:hypothetical protein
MHCSTSEKSSLPYRSVLDPSTQYKMSLSPYSTGPDGIARMTYKHGDQMIRTNGLELLLNGPRNSEVRRFECAARICLYKLRSGVKLLYQG